MKTPPAARSREAESRNITVEVALKHSGSSRTCRSDIIKKAVLQFIEENFESLLPESQIVDWDDLPILAQHVDAIRVAECGELTCTCSVHSYR